MLLQNSVALPLHNSLLFHNRSLFRATIGLLVKKHSFLKDWKTSLPFECSNHPVGLDGVGTTNILPDAQRSLSIASGMFFANPIPAEYSLDKDYMDDIIAQALRDASDSGSSGSDNTPFVLKRIRELTGGSTVTANSALVEANVLRGTRVAVELADMECQQGQLLKDHDG